MDVTITRVWPSTDPDPPGADKRFNCRRLPSVKCSAHRLGCEHRLTAELHIHLLLSDGRMYGTCSEECAGRIVADLNKEIA